MFSVTAIRVAIVASLIYLSTTRATMKRKKVKGNFFNINGHAAHKIGQKISVNNATRLEAKGEPKSGTTFLEISVYAAAQES